MGLEIIRKKVYEKARQVINEGSGIRLQAYYDKRFALALILVKNFGGPEYGPFETAFKQSGLTEEAFTVNDAIFDDIVGIRKQDKNSADRIALQQKLVNEQRDIDAVVPT